MPVRHRIAGREGFVELLIEALILFLLGGFAFGLAGRRRGGGAGERGVWAHAGRCNRRAGAMSRPLVYGVSDGDFARPNLVDNNFILIRLLKYTYTMLHHPDAAPARRRLSVVLRCIHHTGMRGSERCSRVPPRVGQRERP